MKEIMKELANPDFERELVKQLMEFTPGERRLFLERVDNAIAERMSESCDEAEAKWDKAKEELSAFSGQGIGDERPIILGM